MKSSRTLPLILALVVLAVVAISPIGAAKIEISYMAWYNTTQSEANQVQHTIDQFNASQDKIHVTLIAIPRDGYETKVNTMAAGHQLPDCTELSEAMADLRSVGTEILTLGQYLRPSAWHLPVVEYASPERFRAYAEAGRALGFRYVASGPLVRSSYRAGELFLRGEIEGRREQPGS